MEETIKVYANLSSSKIISSSLERDHPRILTTIARGKIKKLNRNIMLNYYYKFSDWIEYKINGIGNENANENQLNI